MIEIISAMFIGIICYGFYKWNCSKIKVHFHLYYKPIVSRYISFNTRDIVYECSCGKREIIRVYRFFGESFPIQTTHHITHKELQEIQNKNTLGD